LPRVLFTFPSRYLSTIGLSGVFSLAGWSRQIQAGFPVPRPTQGAAWLAALPCTGLSPAMACLSRHVPLLAASPLCGPTTPAMPKHRWFGLAPVRSPLLGGSLLFSFPPGNEMFQFPGFASRLAAGYPIARVGCPIRAPADQWLFAPPRGLSQLITPFFASESQGIHRTPLLTFFNRIPVSLFLSFTSNCFPACQRTL
jgi:hypothetical protein